MLALLFSLLIIVLVAVFRHEIAGLGSYGYLGIFVLSVLGAATIIVPVPGLALVFTLGGTLNPLLVGLVSGVGGTLGETTGYLLGYGGRAVVENKRMYQRIEGWMKRWGAVTILVLAIIPNPFFDVAGAAAGALRFPIWKFFLYGGIGRIIKHTFVAFAGAWGMESILRWLN
jgi:membrane protein YqaA with SNARE-associated domain